MGRSEEGGWTDQLGAHGACDAEEQKARAAEWWCVRWKREPLVAREQFRGSVQHTPRTSSEPHGVTRTHSPPPSHNTTASLP